IDFYFFRLKNQQRHIEYVTFPLQKVEQPIADQAIADYYQQYRADFQEPETLVIDYVLLTIDDLAAGVQPTDAELRTFYDEQKGAFTIPEERRVSHILVAADASAAPEAEQAALTKIQAARERILKGEDFAKVAKDVSEDTESAAKGGDLGIIRKETMDPNFEKVALSLGQGVLSEPVRTPFGYHLIKVTDLKPSSVRSFEEAKQELTTLYQRNAVDSRFYELGQKLTETAFEHPDSLDPAAKAIAKTVQRTLPFTREKGEGIAAEKAVRDAAFSDDVLNGKNSDLLELGPEKVAVIRVYDRRPAVEKPLTDVRAEIVRRLRTEQAKEQTRRAAEDMRQKLEDGSSFPSLAKAAKLTLQTPAPIRRNAADLPAPLVEAVFTVPKPKERPVRGTVALEDGAQVVYSVNAVIEQSPAPDDKEVEILKNYLVNTAGQQQFAAWLAQLREAEDVYTAPGRE
ncbi:MAG: peptidyl-prolyl cis-trans isomerase, partial [Methylotetracoccus sp.]|nr:peptidyl-prolyl cis-trans isomerase [Methylotetracoccus sp.]